MKQIYQEVMIFSYFRGFIYNVVALALISSYVITSKANENTELNLDFLQGGRNAQAEAFLGSEKNYFSGNYLVDVQVNGNAKGKRLLTITQKESQNLCFTLEWLSDVEVYINHKFYQSTYQPVESCYFIDKQENTYVNFDVAAQTLTMLIPQAALNKVDKSSDWQFGDNALRLNYNLNANKNKNDLDYYGSGSLLANVGEWVANGSASLTNKEQSVAFFTLSKALLSLQADIVVGKTSVSSGELGGLSTYGVILTSNQLMTRKSLGYMPVFSGTAMTTARVSLSQGNSTLYSEIVPPGPFEITNVAILNGGDVVMTIVENDGSTTKQVFPITLLNGQISPGEHEYSLSIGVTDNNNPEGTPSGGLVAFNYGYGLESFSVRTGALVGTKFVGVTGEMAYQLGSLGSLSTGVAVTRSQYSKEDRQGQKLSMTYAKTFDFGTSLQGAYNQFSEQYDTLGEYDSLNYEKYQTRPKIKNDISVGVNQPLWRGSNFSINSWKREYWHRNGAQKGITSNLSSRIGNVGVSFAGSYYKSGSQDQYSLSTSISVPFSIFDRNVNAFASMSGGKSGSNSYSAGGSTSVTERWSMSVSESWSGDSSLGSQTNIWSLYDGRLAQFNGQITQADYGTTGSVSMNGSLMYLPANNSIMLGKNISDTVAVVNIPNSSGVSMLGGLDKTDRNGNLVVPMNSYQVNTISIDASTLPENTEVLTTSKKVRPTRTSVTYLTFDALHVRRYLLQVRRSNGEFITSGEWAYSKSGAPLGFVTHDGVLLINSVDPLDIVQFSDCKISGVQLKDSNRLQEVSCEN